MSRTQCRGLSLAPEQAASKGQDHRLLLVVTAAVSRARTETLYILAMNLCSETVLCLLLKPVGQEQAQPR